MHIYNRRAYQAAIDRKIASHTQALIAQDRANDLSDVYARLMDTANDLADAYAEQGESILQDAANDLADAYANRSVEPEPGAFRRAGIIYRVKVSRTSGRPYAMVREGSEWVYRPGAISQVRECDRLTFEEACAISAQIGECVICGRTLTAEASVEKGIGPICRKRVRGYVAPIKRARKGAVAA